MYNRVTLLGNAQDAGRPQFACTKPCCEDARLNSELSRMPVSLGLHGDSFGLIEATRCIDKQLTMVNNPKISDLWITHAHLGHIEGLCLKSIETLSSLLTAKHPGQNKVS